MPSASRFPSFQAGVGPWHLVFYGTAVSLALEFVIFTLFASGEEQPWNRKQEEGPTRTGAKMEDEGVVGTLDHDLYLKS